MFEKIKRNLFKFFKSRWYGESINKNESEIGLEAIPEKNKKLEDKRKKYKKVSGVL